MNENQELLDVLGACKRTTKHRVYSLPSWRWAAQEQPADYADRHVIHMDESPGMANGDQLAAFRSNVARPWWFGRHKNSAGWLEYLNKPGLDEFAMNHYRAATAKARHSLKKLGIRSVPNARRRAAVSEEGDSIDIDRYLERESACWSTVRSSTGRVPAMRIGVNFIVPYGFTEEMLVEHLMAAAALLNLARVAGWRTELIGYAASKINSGSVRMLKFPIIRMGQPTNPLLLAKLADAAFSRGRLLLWLNLLDSEVANDYGSGCCTSIPDEVMAEHNVDLTLTEGCVVGQIAKHFSLGGKP